MFTLSLDVLLNPDMRTTAEWAAFSQGVVLQELAISSGEYLAGSLLGGTYSHVPARCVPVPFERMTAVTRLSL